MKKTTDLAASVRQRLLIRSRAHGEEFTYTLSRYAIERFLVRLDASSYRDRFILKGATLFVLWSDESHRATWDLDFLGLVAGSVSDTERVFRDICQTIVPEDGIVFDDASLKGELIREEAEDGGVRVRFQAHLGTAEIPLQVDIGFGDAVFPPAEVRNYPTALPGQPVRVLAYPREAALAEKLEAIVNLGIRNGRMKDFYDLHYMASHFALSGPIVVEAIRRTFRRRNTPLPEETPVGLTEEFAKFPDRAAQWESFVRRGRLTDVGITLASMLDRLREFLLPPLSAARSAEEFSSSWAPGGPWT